jgi:hypothetical protein
LAIFAAAFGLWMAGGPSSVSEKKVPGSLAAAPPVHEETPEIPKELRVAMDRLPHLAPETIQLVISHGEYGLNDPADLFRRAQSAASRGTSALTEEEAQELRTLRASVVGALRPGERERVRAYDRIRVGRDLLSAGEDAKVMALFARGVRALPPPKRERLRELLGKSIAAVLTPAGAASSAPATR